MNKTKYFLVILAAIASGFASSLITVRFFTPYKAVAENIDKRNAQKTEGKTPNKMNVIEANEFRLIDLEGNYLAKLTIEEDKSMLALLEAKTKDAKIYHAVLEMGTGSRKIRITEDNVEIMEYDRAQTSLESSSLRLGDKSGIYMTGGISNGAGIHIRDG